MPSFSGAPPDSPDRDVRSFRKQLVTFSLLLVSIFAIPLLILEVQRPWQELWRLIARSQAVFSDYTCQQIKGQPLPNIRLAGHPHPVMVKGYDQPVMTWEIRIHDLVIEKNPAADSPGEFYRYLPVEPDF